MCGDVYCIQWYLGDTVPRDIWHALSTEVADTTTDQDIDISDEVSNEALYGPDEYIDVDEEDIA